MNMHIDELCDPALLAEMAVGGFVRSQRHPTLPLLIHNYTEKAQYENVWNAATLACRGVVVHAESGVVLARPFTKFFNHGQPGAPELDFDGPVRVTDKADGSLGILYPTSDGWAIATRGSFDSEQARHATALLRSRYPDFVPPDGLTALFEIIYPGNRIVLDYGDLDDLVLLGAVDIRTGRSHGPEAVAGWPGPVVETYAYATLADALAAPARANREGLVVHFTGPDTRLKIKYAEYVRLHRIVTGLNARVVWEAIGSGTLDELLEPLPDEFHAWATKIAERLAAEVAVLTAGVEAAYADVVAALPDGWGRKEFALAVARHPERSSLFLRLDGRDYRGLLWQRVRPAVTTLEEAP